MRHRPNPATGLILAAALVTAAALSANAGAEPATSTTTAPTSSASAVASDEHGFVGSAARCDNGQTLMEFGRTSRSLVAICVDSDGQLEYRAVRLSDQAGLTLPATRGSDGVVIATNDAVTYSVSKDLFLVSEGDTVLYRDTWIEFHTPRFPAGPSTPTSSPTASAAPTTSATSAAPSTSVTVSTTTVTLTPSSQAAKGDG